MVQNTVKERVERVIRKVERAVRDGTLISKANRQASNVFVVPFQSIVGYRALSPMDRMLNLSRGAEDHRGSPEELSCSEKGLERLVAAFAAAERDRSEGCPPELEVRGLWSEWLDLHYTRLRVALRSGDLVMLRGLLENIHRDSMSTGVGGTVDDMRRLPTPVNEYYFRVLWCDYRDRLMAVRPQWNDVESPVVGNPIGMWVDARLVQVETLRHGHHASVVLDLARDMAPLRILEIGGGMGGQAYQFVALSQKRLERYTILDLPEVACLSGYFLLSALGEGRVRLYGETEPTSLEPIVEVLPHWCVSDVVIGSVDIAFNAHSFSEMDSASASYYLREIERIGSRYFYHVNHETRFRYKTADGGRSINRVGSEMVPSEEIYELVSVRPQEFWRPENRSKNGYSYLYERVPT